VARIPSLRRPIPESLLAEEFYFVWERGPVSAYYPKPKIVISQALEEVHRRDPRRYAECEVTRKVRQRRRFVYFAPSTLLLPEANRLGLCAHEAGHLILWDKRHTEDDADQAALLCYGVEVTYDRRWPEKGLQSGAVVRDHPRNALQAHRFPW
jgi:hypothetical protein